MSTCNFAGSQKKIFDFADWKKAFNKVAYYPVPVP
jgi:hypothetical protein